LQSKAGKSDLNARHVKRSQVAVRVGIFAFARVALSVLAAESSEVDSSINPVEEPFSQDGLVSLRVPLQSGENFSFGIESTEEAAEADKLAKQLSNPIASLISVPFQSNEDWGYGPSGNGYKYTLNIQPVVPVSISKDWNVIVRTILPIVSQHDLFFIPNLPKNSPLQPQNRSQDGLSDTLQSFFF